MKLTYYEKALIVSAVAIFYTNVPVYYANHGPVGSGASQYWLMTFCLLSLPMLVIRNTAWHAVNSPLTIWCLGYGVLTLFWFFLSSQSDMAWQEVRWRFLAIIQMLALLMIFAEPAATRLALKALVAAVLFSVTVNIYELFAPLSFSPIIGRSAGLYGNPNMAGEALVLGMILSVTVLPHRYRGYFVLLTGLGILLTFSRAAILTWVIAGLGLMLIGGVRPKHLLVSGTVVLLIALLLLPRWDQLLMTWESTGVINVNVQERLAWFSDPSGVSDESSLERKYVAQQVWHRITERPLLGSGTGSFYEVGIPPHNQYLSFMLDHGILGVMILPLLMAAVAWGAHREMTGLALIFACAILFLSLFTHSILSTGHSLTLLPLMAAMSAMSNFRKIQRMAVEISKEATTKGLLRA